MPSLKDLRTRITSVKSTQRITSAMKMVAAAKLRRAQDQAIAARPYAERMERMLGSLAGGVSGEGGPKLMSGTGKDNVHLLVVMTTDRGLCGGFNGSIMRGIRSMVRELEGQGKTVKLFGVGRKGNAIMRREYPDKLVEVLEEIAKPAPTFTGADMIASKISEMFDNGDFDCCTIVYNKFISALTQNVTPQQLIPFAVPDVAEEEGASGGATASYEYEPDEEEILADLLPRNLSVQVFRAMLETFASEQGARMTAMDSASRNAGDMIDKLTLTYNRARQAGITKELIEIISGAEAL
tara:strand:+ start:1734 stop:2621 length:888 start_codon:yes stop_codon:yes gene_type:complete